jgi:hypothetical protein
MKEDVDIIFGFFSKPTRFHFVAKWMTKFMFAFLPFLVKITIIIPWEAVSQEGRTVFGVGANVNKTITKIEEHLTKLFVTNRIKDPLLRN